MEMIIAAALFISSVSVVLWASVIIKMASLDASLDASLQAIRERLAAMDARAQVMQASSEAIGFQLTTDDVEPDSDVWDLK